MGDKRICIVTNYSTTTNFGALLQAFALNHAIQELGYAPVNLYVVGDTAYRGKKFIKQLKSLQFRKIVNEINNRVQMHRVRDQLNARKKVMDEFRFMIPHTERYVKDNLSELQNHYDIFICGSDQIFRPNPLTGELEDYFWLDMVKDDSLKASYAASMGIATYDKKNEEKAKKYLSSFKRISIREKSSAEYIKKITGREDVVASIDPVFLIGHEEWTKLERTYQIDEPYILVYMIHGTEKLYASIKEFSKMVDTKIVTFPSMSYKKKSYEVNFADIEILDANPFQFVNLIDRAAYIFTDSFHGTAFSIILHKEAFVSEANEIAFSRIDNILNITHSDQLVIPSEGLKPEEYLKLRAVDWDLADREIQKQREESVRYLREIID